MDLLKTIESVGLTPEQYMERFELAATNEPPATADAEARELFAFTQLNLHRTQRILRTWRPSAALTAGLGRITARQTWLVITEPWCGDSAQCLPCLEIMALKQPNITMRLVQRDKNPAIMDLYLTNGTRSIPRLVALADDGAELFHWGPRPAAAQAVVDAAKAAGLSKPELLVRLHLFYGRDRGAAIDAEFVALLGGGQ